MHLHTSNQGTMELGFGDHSCNWGTHIAGLYETEEERDQILGGFIQKGVEDGDYLCYELDESSDVRICNKIKAKNASLTQKLKTPGQVDKYSAKELYYPDGTFSPYSMDKGLAEMLLKAQSTQTGKVRASGEMSWALENIPGVEHLMVYESRLNNFIKDKPWVSVCLYDLTCFSGEVIMDVFRTHPFIINKGVITDNPFYMNPEDWLKENGYPQE